jgi:hypothetical protein
VNWIEPRHGPIGRCRRRYHFRIAGAPTEPDPGDSGSAGEPLSTLRGAGAGLDVRLVGRVVGSLVLVALAVAVVIFFIAGVHKNAQISSLRHQGVPVAFRISGCLGLLGGSGSNQAGYACRGSFSLQGRIYNEPIPGNSLHEPGTVLRAVAVPGDPALVITARMLDGEEASGKVYVLPAVLLIVLVLLIGALVLRRRRIRRA